MRQLTLALALIFVVSLGTRSQAQDIGLAGDALQQHLAAGEFGPARDLAMGHSNPAVRNEWLGEIARMQAANGASRGAFRSLSEINDDRSRLSAIDSIHDAPFGAGALGGARGGGAMADFDTLMELIKSTVAPDSWEDNGGLGAMEPFPTGVLVDSAGVLNKIDASDPQRLEALRRRAATSDGNRDPRKSSPLRKVSLNRLEKEIQLRWLSGQAPDEIMRNLAGMYRVKYVLLYPDTGDIVLAGPAGDWQPDGEGSLINRETHAPVLHLDDLIVLLRQARGGGDVFGCAITPRQENLAKTQEFLAASPVPSRAPQQKQWLEQLRSTVGRQDIDVFGIDERTRVARIMVEADYRMKRVGLGLEDGTLGVTNYLSLVAADDKKEDMSVLRWWFAMHYDAVRTNDDRSAFEIVGQSVRVMSENEMLAARGERVHTGTSEEKNQQFADSFTGNFDALAEKYPIYAELRNVFDLALVSAVMEREGLADRASWHLTHFGDPQRYAVPLAPAAKEVDTIVNSLTRGKKFVAAASGGVRAEPSRYVSAEVLQVDQSGRLDYDYQNSSPADRPQLGQHWWWD